MTADLLTEAEKMRRVPGIIFADGPTGRRARIAGTGLEVFEVIASYRGMGQDWERLKKAFHFLAAADGRCVVTEKYDDFTDLTLELLQRGAPHADVLFVPHALHDDYNGIAAGLVDVARRYPQDLDPYTIMWLPRMPS